MRLQYAKSHTAKMDGFCFVFFFLITKTSNPYFCFVLYFVCLFSSGIMLFVSFFIFSEFFQKKLKQRKFEFTLEEDNSALSLLSLVTAEDILASGNQLHQDEHLIY